MRNLDLSPFLDFPLFSQTFFKIRTKTGLIKPFALNRAQLYAHEQLEKQRRETGSVRAIILKGRQLGLSTLIQARYFHKTITNRGIKTFILTHEAEATKNLFDMTKRFYENLPDGLAPAAARDSSKELRFESLDSGYAVGTAGNRGAGRSQTIQLCHCSEVAFYEHAQEHAQGLMQAVSGKDGTELILESTANGIGNYFYNVWAAAEKGTNGFLPIFIPWYWDDDYKIIDYKATLTHEEHALMDLFGSNGLTKEHLFWRRIKIFEFDKDYEIGKLRFDQEYPICAAVAFANPIDDTFIHSRHVLKARSAIIENASANLVIGVDPAIGENDRCAIISRTGRKAHDIIILKNHNTMQLAGYIKNLIETKRPYKVFIDCIGIGAGVVDRLHEMGFTCVEGVNVARTAHQKDRFGNQRAELWSEMRDWLTGELDVQIPDSDELHADLCSLGYKHRSNGQLLIESKEDLKKRGLPSPDIADALALTFVLGQNVVLDNSDFLAQQYAEKLKTSAISHRFR
jgi:hypothetical protein